VLLDSILNLWFVEFLVKFIASLKLFDHEVDWSYYASVLPFFTNPAIWHWFPGLRVSYFRMAQDSSQNESIFNRVMVICFLNVLLEMGNFDWVYFVIFNFLLRFSNLLWRFHVNLLFPFVILSSAHELLKIIGQDFNYLWFCFIWEIVTW